MRIIRMIKGFTLLELIIVIIITGVLASLSIPSMTIMIEKSKAIEAIQAINEIRKSILLCGLHQQLIIPDYSQCDEWDEISIENPQNVAGAIFDYTITSAGAANLSFRIRATRNNVPGGGCGGFGPTDHWIEFSYFDDGSMTKQGNGFYASIQ